MSWLQVATAAGVIATVLFVLSALPMLVKAARTKDLGSYSSGNLVVANIGNLAQALYLTIVPPGPIWALHAFNSATSAIMLLWWIRHRPRATPQTTLGMRMSGRTFYRRSRALTNQQDAI